MPITAKTISALGYDALLSEPVKNINGRVIRLPELKQSTQIVVTMPDKSRISIRVDTDRSVILVNMTEYSVRCYKTDRGLLGRLEAHGLVQATILLRKMRINKLLKDL